MITFLGSTREENILMVSTGFFLEMTFHMNKHEKHGLSFCSYHMLMRVNFDPIWSKLS